MSETDARARRADRLRIRVRDRRARLDPLPEHLLRRGRVRLLVVPRSSGEPDERRRLGGGRDAAVRRPRRDPAHHVEPDRRARVGDRWRPRPRSLPVVHAGGPLPHQPGRRQRVHDRRLLRRSARAHRRRPARRLADRGRHADGVVAARQPRHHAPGTRADRSAAAARSTPTATSRTSGTTRLGRGRAGRRGRPPR